MNKDTQSIINDVGDAFAEAFEPEPPPEEWTATFLTGVEQVLNCFRIVALKADCHDELAQLLLDAMTRWDQRAA